MALKDKLPVSYLLFTSRGRINRRAYWLASLFIWTTFYVLFNVIEWALSYSFTLVLYPVLFLALICTATKRLHDGNKAGYWLWLLLIPVLGPLILLYRLGFKKGTPVKNRFGVVPGSAPDYFRNGIPEKIPHLKTDERIVNDITRLNPVLVCGVRTPESVDMLQQIIREYDGPVCIGGGRFSMGGQTASRAALHIDMRLLNKVVSFSPEQKTILVEAGTRWCDIQQYVDPYDLSIRIMQTYANFTVGGALSVNCHGRYVGLGPLILSVRSVDLIMADGALVKASPHVNTDLFYACVGCYNAVAVIARVELELTENVLVKRVCKKMDVASYSQYFVDHVRNNPEAVFHNGDLYPPHYEHVRAVSWIKTTRKATVKTRLMPIASAYPLERYFIGAFSKSRFGKWRREYLIDPLLYAARKVHPRNFEAGYDVLELEPVSREQSTYVLQEYFIGVDKFDAFAALMAEIFNRFQVNVINVSVRHALPDSGSLLAWAKEEVFAFVIWYKQATDETEKNKVSVWTRELIEASLSLGGSYYLPYQPHATPAQFHAAYPNAEKLFALKKKLDPAYKFRNVLWDTYYHSTLNL